MSILFIALSILMLLGIVGVLYTVVLFYTSVWYGALEVLAELEHNKGAVSTTAQDLQKCGDENDPV